MSFRDKTYEPFSIVWLVWGLTWFGFYCLAMALLSELANMPYWWMTAKVTAASLGVFAVVLELAYRGAIKPPGAGFQLRLSSLFLWTIVAALCFSVLRSVIVPAPRLPGERVYFQGAGQTVFVLGLAGVIVFFFTLWLGHSLLWLAVRLIRLPMIQSFLRCRPND